MSTMQMPWSWNQQDHAKRPSRRRLVGVSGFLAGVVLGGLGMVEAGARAAGPDVRPDEEPGRSFLARHCVECHGAKAPRKGLRLDQLAADFADPGARARWQAVLKRVQAGEMPPEDRPRPSAQEVQALTRWIGDRIAAQPGEDRVVLRRLNRVEYENTVHDLLGVAVPLQEQLPADGSMDGFDNVGAALHTSSFLLERYLEAADKALNAAIANGPRPVTQRTRFSLKEERKINTGPKTDATGPKPGAVYRLLDDAAVLFSSSPATSVRLAQFYPPARGRYRFRISAYGFQSSGKPVTFAVTAGATRRRGSSGLVGYFDAPADRAAVFEFVEYLEPRETLTILPYGLVQEQALRRLSSVDQYRGPGLAVQWFEVEGPLIDSWPPESHRRLFGDLAQAPAPGVNARERVEVVSRDAVGDAERILRNFARRAFRRDVSEDDIRPYVQLIQAELAAKASFEEAVRTGLQAVMVSPDFLFLREKPGRLNDFALASRLSYFLWSSMPDDELLTLAGQGKLGQPEILRRQVERLLRDSKAVAFTENFVGQWLGLRDIDFTAPSHILYPEFDEMLKVSMVREAELFFTQILREDLSLMNTVASDFSMLNGRLALHYGIPGVEGWEFRKVSLPPERHRGGVLTMAAVLKVTANGTTTSPVMRGAWVLDRILGTPPAPPPDGVAGLDPDIRGATTIREQLAKHRSVASCASCHTKIDPPGFALESFDVIGGWRDHYRVSGFVRDGGVVVDGQKMRYYKGPKVDPADRLPDGQAFASIDEFKQLLLRDRDQIARALTGKLLTYATGAGPTLADGPAIETIVGAIRDRNYGLRTLVHEIVQSKPFQNK